jgi:SAM-dependent methyltransferase
VNEKVDITKRYIAEEEIRTDSRPYVAFYKTLSKTFDFDKVKSFCDVGCATGHLINEIKKAHPHVEVAGVEYFEYHKEAAPELVQSSILVHDVREPFSHIPSAQYDIVLCTEVGEHIDPEYASIFLENLKRLTRKYLIMSWSDTGGINDPAHDPNHQHLNPLKFEEFKALMESNGFYMLDNQTAKLLEASNQPDFHDWWRKSLSIWRVKNA